MSRLLDLLALFFGRRPRRRRGPSLTFVKR